MRGAGAIVELDGRPVGDGRPGPVAARLTAALQAMQDSDSAAGLQREAEARLAGSLLVSVETVGEGAILSFAHDPAFRLFWRATMPLLLNAVLYGPSGGLEPAGSR